MLSLAGSGQEQKIAFILMAIQNHNELVDALIAAENAITYNSEEEADAGEYSLPRDVCDKIRLAISKVRINPPHPPSEE